jgi:hypothetical protein
MNGPIAQIVALTCHGNAFLCGQPGPQFFPINSTCQFCERVMFVTLSKSIFGKSKEAVIAAHPDAWFGHLKAAGVRGIRLLLTPQNAPGLSDRMSAGFVGGGGTWTMEALFRGGTSEFWIARWEVSDQTASDKRIWRVTYGLVSRGTSHSSSKCGLPTAIHELDESLSEIRAFSARQQLDGFTKCFDDALDTIQSQGRNRHGYHQDLAPTGFPTKEAAVLLDACQKSWVFGGMGSWNDMMFDGEEQQTYERVSERLFRAVNSAIEQAATSTMKED